MTRLYQRFIELVLAAAQKHIGMKTVGISSECWKTKEIAVVEKEKDSLWEKAGI